ncbi:flagellar hook-basal body complex protein [Agilicoccus flavus]|uniref:flagellar hook-basal body complex protein n=1 Tax=Agilicoccus flavus TaxID=2775968 RepID=UPI001CF61FA1|nr:flagellar hook-basal body complex protein [Agilicoccus flavus]
MIRSMWSAVSGLRNHQIYLDVTGNNIANVNTTGYKSTRAVFEDSLSQVVRNASGPNVDNGVGGMNPSQIGLGVRLGQISGNFTQGGLQVTNVATDIAIQGDGFFIVDKGGQKFFTRNGAFSLDKEGYLVTGDGSYVMGDGPDATDASGAEKIQISAAAWQNFQIAPNGTISGVAVGDATGTLVDIGKIALSKFNNPNGLERVGGTMFKETLNSGSPELAFPADNEKGMGFVTAGTLEMSNVDLAGEFTNLIMAQRGFQANSKVVSASDEVLQDLINMKR